MSTLSPQRAGFAHPSSTQGHQGGWLRLARLLLTLAGLLLPQAAAIAQYNGPITPTDNSAAAPVTGERRLLYPSTPEVLLTSGDLLSIHLFGDPDYSVSARIATDGTVLLPLIGTVSLSGLSTTAAEQMIGQRLETAGMYRSPQVLLQVLEGPTSVVTVAGEMHAVVPVVGSRSLYAVIASAGGLPSSASRNVTILRPGQAQPLTVDIGNDPLHSATANVPTFPGDTIIVSRIGVVYVMGEFHSPGVVPLTNYGPLTLAQVSAIVGGPLYDAKYDKLHIIRTSDGRKTVSTLNIKDVLYGRAADPVMQPNDIVFLPPSGLKESLSNGSLGSLLGVVSFALAAISTLR